MNPDLSRENGEAMRAEEQFRLVVESSPAALVIVNQLGQIVLVNQQTENWFGYRREELVGRDVEVLIPHRFHTQHRQDRNDYLASPQPRPMGVGHELFGRRKDDSEFPVDISLHPMQSADGDLVMAHIIDLTDRKQAEIETQKRYAVERLALLGQLAGGVAHEIRNPLGVIRNAAYYLQMVRDSLDPEAQESIAEIQREVDRANRIVSDLLDYAREPQNNIGTFDLAELVHHVAEAQQESLGAHIQFESVTEPILVTADPDQVERILTNLIRNGVQASDEPGTLTISIRRDDEMVITDVIDDGVGIDEKDRLRLFEPLYTTKAKGIGLGLAVSKRYAERNGGQLEYIDDSASGSTFRLTLPIGRNR